MTRMRGKLAVVIISATLATACGGSNGGSASSTSDACNQAFDMADAQFDHLASEITTVRRALSQAFAGNMDNAQSILDTVSSQGDPARYKQLEAECRAG